MALYSKFCGSELIKIGLNKSLFRVEQVKEKERKKERKKKEEEMIFRARSGSELIFRIIYVYFIFILVL